MNPQISAECVLDANCALGEGPVWRAAENALWFVDIKQDRIHRFLPDTGEHRTWATPSAPGFLAPMAGGRWIAGLKSGLHRFDPLTGAFEWVLQIEDPALENRMNDGFVDAQGRLWFGSMHDPETALSGVLYRFDHRGVVRMDEGYCVTNGPAASPDGRTLYHADTLRRVIYAFDLTVDGELQNRRAFVRIENEAGYPDGLTVDAEGCVWVGLFSGWAARRYGPDGRLRQVIDFPVANVTKIAFGGADLKTAYATTARTGLSFASLAEQPLAGSVFRFQSSVPGLPQQAVQHA